MILIFGGTTEGRVAAQVCGGALKPIFYSTKSEGQVVEAAHIVQIHGGMSPTDIIEFCRQRDVRLIVDAAHPFADNLHRNVVEAASQCRIPTIRFDRLNVAAEVESPSIGESRFPTLGEAVEHIRCCGYKRPLALTGVKSARGLKELASEVDDLRVRIMDREESWAELRESGFPLHKVEIYGQRSDEEIIAEHRTDVMLIKESGRSGGEDKKRELAQRLGVDLVVIQRPQTEIYDRVVYGPRGLRLAIERLLPDFFELSTGFTTGSCATAAAVVALRRVLSGRSCEYVDFVLPCGERTTMAVTHVEGSGEWAKASVTKDGGDDPDVTNGATIWAEVKFGDHLSGVKIEGGRGVGRVTIPGLGLEVGQSAINPVPRRMIADNLLCEMKRAGVSGGVEVTISVEGGEELAQKTFNPRLGIVGGISILGTSGIVHPFSKEAFLESIQRQIDMVKALGGDRVVINSGGKSERFLRAHFGDIGSEFFVQYGNMIGDTIELCAKAHLREVILGVMIGKAVKLAEGRLDTHSKRGVMNVEFLLKLSHEAGCSPTTQSRIGEITTARELWDIIPSNERRFFALLKGCCYDHCKEVSGGVELRIVLVRDDGEIF